MNQEVRRETRNNLEPLLFEVFGKPINMKVKTWVYRSENPGKIKRGYASLDFQCRGDTQSVVGLGQVSVVFGKWEYRNTASNRPSSTVEIESGQLPVYDELSDSFPFCMKDASTSNFLGKILSRYSSKQVSFWWDVSTPLYNPIIPEQVIAELSIGSANPARFVADTETRIKVGHQHHLISHNGWEPVESLPIRVGIRETNFYKSIVFDIKDYSLLPEDIYDAITKPLRDEIAYTLGLLKGMPMDTNIRIMKYANANTPIEEFDCKDASKLLPLHIGPLIITPKMMYERVTESKCKITVQRNDIASFIENLVIGIDLIRQFHLLIHYDSLYGDTLEFATRTGGEHPIPPTNDHLDDHQKSM